MTCTPTLGRLALSVCAALLLTSCGGGGETEPAQTAQGERRQALALPQGTPIPGDAPSRGMFGPVQSWSLIPLHVVLTPDGRVMSYGTDGSGKQTAYFIYDVWDPSDNSHTTFSNGTGTDIFCTHAS